MQNSSFTALALVLALSAPAAADPTLGLGATFTWGGGSQGDTGVGLRAFSNDERGEFVGTLGVDYMLGTQRVRPNVGVAYLAAKSYVGMDVGYDFGSGGVDVGIGLGLANSHKKSTPAPAPAPVPAPGVAQQ